MNILKIDLEHCYGIRQLHTELDFSGCSAVAIYAPNGSMKTSLSQVFQDIADNVPSKDRVFTDRASRRLVQDEAGVNIPPEQVLVIRPYDETIGESPKIATLLVNQNLRLEYERLNTDIDAAKATFLKALREQSHSKRDIEKELSLAFTASPGKFYVALNRIKDEVTDKPESALSRVPYDLLFDEKVLQFLETKDFKTAIGDFIKKYNELLSASTYFKKGIFNYYNAGQVAKQLADNGFFKAQHSINLNAKVKKEITTEKELEDLITGEKEVITKDKELRKKYSEIEKLIQKNISMRDFEAYLSDHEELLSKFANMGDFRQEVWKAYSEAHFREYSELLNRYQQAEERRKEIEEQAHRERTQWAAIIEIFNERFFVPFRLEITNQVDVILGQQPPNLGFVFVDGTDNAPVDRESLLRVLSTGEKKAFYILNVLFEIEVRKKAGQHTLIIVDDVADSFDYKNKYAIIQYLMDIASGDQFRQVLLTHNFDFYRTVESRFVGYGNCRMVAKTDSGIAFEAAVGIKNIFVNDWKPAFFSDVRKKLACISFMRNLIEYTRGTGVQEFGTLTSLLHWKPDSLAITVTQLDTIYNDLFSTNGKSPNGDRPVIDLLWEDADRCLTAPDGINFPNKVILAIATRLAAERHMANKIGNQEWLASITTNQTAKLIQRFNEMYPSQRESQSVLQRVALMTPENIHLNSFMYEPILDMSDAHLRRLYTDVSALK